jgi:hypothetical protein
MMAGGPYMVGAIFNVTDSAEQLANNSAIQIRTNFEEALIDDPTNMVDMPSFVIVETLDTVVTTNQQYG